MALEIRAVVARRGSLAATATVRHGLHGCSATESEAFELSRCILPPLSRLHLRLEVLNLAAESLYVVLGHHLCAGF
jgi:hypothetical protein